MQRHEFAAVVEQAEALLERNPSDAGVLGMFGDALMELGQYERAEKVYVRMVTLNPGLFSFNRVAYYEFVVGHPAEAVAWMQAAVRAGSPVAENQAWCLAELGDLLFKTGRLDDAKDAYIKALAALPGYHRAYAGVGAVQVAQGDMKAGIDSFRRAQSAVPLPQYAAALEGLYESTNRTADARRQRVLIDAADKLMLANGEKANRALALVYANQGRNLERALELAQAELKMRGDVYTFDALAWVFYRSNRLAEASEAAAKALSQYTPEPSFYYHAGMIALAAGKPGEAKTYLQRALSLNPRFDLRDAPLAHEALRKLP
jgi:tetratricopeptide (TPR) repeat protein